MISPNNPHGREDLSALFDGELHGDASRFAHKRLAQDVEWRQACGTWQLVGDVLRGNATAAAPADFADRVQLALAHESAAAMGATSRSRRGWVGGAALAASVALAAWFVASPLDEAAPVMQAAAVATATPSPTAPEPVARPSAAEAVADDAASRDGARPSRGQGGRTALAEPLPRAAAVPAAVPTPAAGQPLASTSAASADPGGIDAAALADPFQLPNPQLATRPWPRAVLPNYPVTGALTAGYGVPLQNPGVAAAGAPGFYPFEPRLPPDADAAAASDAQ